METILVLTGALFLKNTGRFLVIRCRLIDANINNSYPLKDSELPLIHSATLQRIIGHSLRVISWMLVLSALLIEIIG